MIATRATGIATVAIVATVVLLSGCATPEPPAPVTAAEPPPPSPPAKPAPRQDTLKHLANRTLKPLPERPLNARAKCNFRDETGYRGRLNLAVKGARVEHFDARIDMPKRGSCNFRLADFRQTEGQPTVVLAARGSDCKVSLWEQGDRVTVAFRDCREECSGSSAEYLWPILVDNRKGSCS